MRERCLKTIYELAQRDERVVFVGSDLGAGVLDDFRRTIPDRFFMEGVSEQNLVGVAAGLAMEGRVVYLHTIATFLTRRCFEQVAVDLCLHNVNVRLIASGGGCVYAPLGPTHLAIEDLTIMRALPNMAVVAPADAVEMVRFVRASLDHPGPIYVRVAKGHDPVVTTDTGPFEAQSGRPVPFRVAPRRPGDAAGCWCDPSRAKAELGWVATRELDEMCADVWRWQSQNPNGFAG